MVYFLPQNLNDFYKSILLAIKWLYLSMKSMMRIQICHLRLSFYFQAFSAEVINNNIKMIKEKALKKTNIPVSYLAFSFHQESWFWAICHVGQDK